MSVRPRKAHKSITRGLSMNASLQICWIDSRKGLSNARCLLMGGRWEVDITLILQSFESMIMLDVPVVGLVIRTA